MMHFLQSDPLKPRVVARFKEKTAMAVVLRNVADHDWGWFSREDDRMHLQTVEEGSRTGQSKAKVWLEDKGQRVLTLAEGKLSGTDLKKLRAKLTTERPNIESRWINFMIKNRWLKIKIDGSIVKMTAYPESHNRYEREIDLREEFPGSYDGPRSWDITPPKVDLDPEHAALAVGREENLDDREHIDLTKWLFKD